MSSTTCSHVAGSPNLPASKLLAVTFVPAFFVIIKNWSGRQRPAQHINFKDEE
jgi:hypothetical protein